MQDLSPFTTPTTGAAGGDRVLLAHGSGGLLSHRLISELLLTRFRSPLLARLDDSALLDPGESRLAFTTDSYVVQPLFFPGGDIGRLAVCGTVNDLAVSGACPKYLSCALIVEEGLPVETLERVLDSMAAVAEEAGVEIVTGDTKVVERGAADGLFLNTAGVGFVAAGRELGIEQIRPGDRILISGTLGDHGVSVLAQREGFLFESPLESDCAPLNGMIEALLNECPGVRFLRDPTRGGVAATLNEIAASSGLSLAIEEQALPISESVRSFCDALGLDPLYVANEGKVIVVVEPDDEARALQILRKHPLGKQAQSLGVVEEASRPSVRLRTAMGGSRLVEMLSGDQLPRIC